MTKGQIESKISEAVSKFEIEQMGRGPERIKSTIVQDMVIVRLKGFLSSSERRLAQAKDGIELIKKVRTMLFESAISDLVAIIEPIVGLEVTSTHSDVSTRTGEKLIVLILSENLEDRLKG